MRQDAQSEKSEGLITILSRHASDQFRFMVLSRQPNAFWPSCPAILSHSNGYLLTCRSLAASTNGDRGATLGAGAAGADPWPGRETTLPVTSKPQRVIGDPDSFQPKCER